jgi:hypothetical protein
MAKKKAPVAMTPGRKAYQVALEGLGDSYEDYAEGKAEDDDFTTPGRQKKVAKQIAKLHNRLLKKSKIEDIDELDENI